MKKIVVYCKCVGLIVVVVSIFGRVESTNADRQAPGAGFTVAGGGVCREGELLVRFAPRPDGKQTSSAEKKQILTSLGGAALKHSFKIVPGLTLVKLPAGQKVQDALKTFNNINGILYAGPNYKLELMSTFPNDPDFSEQWGLHNTGQTGGTEDADIDAPEAWDISTGSSDIIVAVIDTGIDRNHLDLASNMWVNEDEEPGDGNGDGCPGVCGEDDDGDGLIDEDSNDLEPNDPNYANDLDNDDDENGYNDDFYGWNFYDNNNNTMDEWHYGHGTLVAGVLGAVGDNDEGVVGVCWNVKIMNLRIFPESGQEPPYDVNSVLSSAIEAIDYAVDNGAKVLSNAYSFYVDAPPEWKSSRKWPVDPNYLEDFKDVIDAAGEAGVLYVNGASNEGFNNDEYDIYPINFDCNNIIVVMATDQDDERSDWEPLGRTGSSNYGANTVDLAAPGTSILTCVPGNEYYSDHGTSLAQPHVAGACALLWSANPYLSHLQVKQIIMDTVDVKEQLEDDPELGRLCVTGGRLNVYKAMDSLYNFTVKNSSDEPVAWFDSWGNLFLKGTLTSGGTCTAPAGSFIIANSTDETVAYIDNEGNMCIEGDWSELYNTPQKLGA